MARVIDISYDESLSLEGAVYVDVRSPGEFDDDHIPGAVNIPLFNDNERASVGTLYRSSGRDEAVLLGTDLVGKKLKLLVEGFTALGDAPQILYCARGGMRSGSLASLLASLGRDVYRLDSGYKGYRHHILSVLENFEPEVPIYVIQGLTGTGKTEIIRELDYAVDLEGLAGHRSSIFGGIGLVQKSQKAFEGGIVDRLRAFRDVPFLVVEGESRKLGNLHIPDRFFTFMKQGKTILVTAPLERRIDILCDDYTVAMDVPAVADIVRSLRQKIGQENVDRMIGCLERGAYREVTAILLEKYYDPLYAYSLEKLSPIGTVENSDSGAAAREIAGIIARDRF